MNYDINTMTLREKIGQTACAFPAVDLTDKKNCEFGCDWSVGGLKMAFANMDFTPRDDLVMTTDEYLQKRQEMNSIRKIPVISAMDCTWGIDGAFYELSPISSPPAIGSANDTDIAFEIGKIRGRHLKRAGANWWWGPEADLVSRRSEISFCRLYSDEPERLTKFNVAEMLGCQSVGVAATAKHFPGADEMEYRDPHTSFQMLHISYEDWKKRQGKVYQTLVDEGIYSVMMSHMAFPAYDNTKVNGHYLPSSASEKIIMGLLKGEMGFEGVVISDALKMLGLYSVFGNLQNVYIAALKAGNDMLLGVDADYIDVIEEAVKRGEISEERINDACSRVLKMKEKLGLFDNATAPLESIEALNAETRLLNKKIAELSITTEANKINLLPAKNVKSVAIIALSSNPAFIDILKGGICKSFEKRGIKTSVTLDLFSYDEIDKIANENDLIIYACARNGKNKYFTVDDMESFNFVLHSGAEKSVGISFADPFVYFDHFSIFDTFLNAYDTNNEAQDAAVATILGELPLRNTKPFKVVPEDFTKYENL